MNRNEVAATHPRCGRHGAHLGAGMGRCGTRDRSHQQAPSLSPVGSVLRDIRRAATRVGGPGLLWRHLLFDGAWDSGPQPEIQRDVGPAIRRVGGDGWPAADSVSLLPRCSWVGGYFGLAL